jgi:hypothetical protein
VHIWSDKPHEIIAKTPIGDEIQYLQNANDTLVTDHRTYKSLIISDLDYEIDFFREDTLLIIVKGDEIKYFISTADGSKIHNSLSFLFKETPLIKAYFVLWSVLFLLTMIYFYRKFRHIHFKIKLFRFLLKGGRCNPKNINLSKIKFSFSQRIIIFASLIMLISATYMRLGDYPFSQTSEEGRRVLVSLEMKLQDNYWLPTVCGEPYYNKPPLFNWLIVPVIENKNIEFATRSVSASILLLSGLLLFFILRPVKGQDHAALVILMFLSSLFVIGYISMVLNLDTLFAFLLILLFYLNYHYAVKRKFWLMYCLGYLVTSLAFMTKGFPALWFQGVSILISLALIRQLKKLFSFQHIVGLLILILIPGLYFLKYSEYGDVYSYLGQLLNETTRVKDYKLSEILSHIFAFPFFNMIAFAPALLLLPFVFLRRSVITIIRDKRLTYLISLVIVGSSIFAVTPYYSPYYSLMFVPLIIDVLISLIPSLANISKREQVYTFIWGVFLCLISIMRLDIQWYILLLFLLVICVIVFFNKHRVWIIISLGVGMILFKLIYPIYSFNKEMYLEGNRNKCYEIARTYSNKKIVIDSKDVKINFTTIFYLTYYNKQIVEYSSSNQSEIEAIFINDISVDPVNVVIIDTIPQRYWFLYSDEIMRGKNEFYPVVLYEKSK